MECRNIDRREQGVSRHFDEEECQYLLGEKKKWNEKKLSAICEGYKIIYSGMTSIRRINDLNERKSGRGGQKK